VVEASVAVVAVIEGLLAAGHEQTTQAEIGRKSTS